MPAITRLAALAAAAFAVCAPAARAQDCDTVILPNAVVVLQTVTQPGASLAGQMALMDSYVQSCPDHAWINALGGELDVMVFKTIRANNGGVANQEAVSFLARAFRRSNMFQKGPDEGRKSRYHILGLNNGTHLDYSVASDSRRAIMDSLAQLALAGTVHPYLKPEQPVECKGWLTSDAQTVGYKVSVAADKVLLPFVEAAANACRTASGQMDRLPLAVLAQAYMKLVDKAQVTDAAEIERLLKSARRNADDFKGNAGYHTLLFSEGDDQRLKALIRKHGVHNGDGPQVIDRSLWFTQEYIGSEVAIRSIVQSFSDYWTPLAAGETEAPSEDVARARNQMTSYVLQLKREGTETARKDQTEAMLREAVTAFQKGEISPPEAATKAPMMPWLYDMIIRLITPPPAAE
ncbi:MAG: hypothetical protein ACK4P2_05175 [Hyphomonas sp.]